MDLDVYGLCLGGNVFGWTADRDASFAVLDAYVEAGGNFIDTADTYMRPNMGISETIIGEWMTSRGNRDSLVIATKVGSDGGLGAANIASHAIQSLERLQTDRIDLYYAHKDDGSVPVEETVRAFDALVREGRVLHVAMSNTTGERLAESLELAEREGLARYEWLQPHYNLVERAGYEQRVRAGRGALRARRGALLRAGERVPDGQVPRRLDPRLGPGAGRRPGTSTRAGEAVLAALDEVAAAHEVAVAAVADRVAAHQARHHVPDRERPHRRAARGRPARASASR